MSYFVLKGIRRLSLTSLYEDECCRNVMTELQDRETEIDGGKDSISFAQNSGDSLLVCFSDSPDILQSLCRLYCPEGSVFAESMSLRQSKLIQIQT